MLRPIVHSRAGDLCTQFYFLKKGLALAIFWTSYDPRTTRKEGEKSDGWEGAQHPLKPIWVKYSLVVASSRDGGKL